MILVVEPDDETQELIISWLQGDGFRFIAVDRLHDAQLLLARPQSRAFSAVFCAAVMPDLQLRDLVESLRSLPEETKIFVMAAFDDAIPEDIASLRLDGVLNKPLAREDLRRCLAMVSPRRLC